ncbi:MAG: hypothetical protein NC311_16725 [Muribaculaceae bacterium]|nr:hypothetical protein [Muribaculaceae bacterium]
MFGLFAKKEMNTEAATAFWKWYVENEQSITEKLKVGDFSIIGMIDGHLGAVFPYCKNLEFQLGGLGLNGEGTYEFLLFHCGNKNLMRDMAAFKSMMPAELAAHINLVIEK